MMLDMGMEDVHNFCVLHLTGISPEGCSVMVHVHGFSPWIYAKAPNAMCGASEKGKQMMCDELREQLEKRGVSVESVEMVHRKQLVGWEPQLEDPTQVMQFLYLRITLQSVRSYYLASRVLKQGLRAPSLTWIRAPQQRLPVLEHNSTHLHSKLSCLLDCSFSEWITVAGFAPQDGERQSTCQYEITCAVPHLRACPEVVGIPPLVIASFDLECMSQDGTFPRAHRPGDPIIQVGVVVEHFNSGKAPQQLVLCLGDTEPVDGVEIRTYDTEQDLIDAFALLIREELDADMLLGYNIFNFDFPYLANRAALLYLCANHTEMELVEQWHNVKDLQRDEQFLVGEYRTHYLAHKVAHEARARLGQCEWLAPLHAQWKSERKEWNVKQQSLAGQGYRVGLQTLKQVLGRDSMDQRVGEWAERMAARLSEPKVTSPWDAQRGWEQHVVNLLVDLPSEKAVCELHRYMCGPRGGARAALPPLFQMSRMKQEVTPLVRKPLSNAAMGNNLISLFLPLGRIPCDLYLYIKTNMKMTSYKLDRCPSMCWGWARWICHPRRSLRSTAVVGRKGRQRLRNTAPRIAPCLSSCLIV